LKQDHPLFGQITRALLEEKLGLKGEYYPNQAIARDCGISAKGKVSLFGKMHQVILIFQSEALVQRLIDGLHDYDGSTQMERQRKKDITAKAVRRKQIIEEEDEDQKENRVNKEAGYYQKSNERTSGKLPLNIP
jgi:hypothetical protein